MAAGGCEPVARITFPSAMVGGTALANIYWSESAQICRRLRASNAAKRPGRNAHCASPFGIAVHTIPAVVPFADSELYPPGIPSVGGRDSVPVAVRLAGAVGGCVSAIVPPVTFE